MAPSFRRAIKRWAIAAALVAALVLGGVATLYRDQLSSYVTHLKGSPTSTVAWRPFSEGTTPDLHLTVIGDCGVTGGRLDATADAIDDLDRHLPVDALLSLGDNVYPNGDPTRLGDTIFQPFADLLDHADLYAVLGNHDVMDGHASGQVRALGMPGRWWAQHLDDVLLIGLDSNLADDPAQRAWLESTLSNATERWRIVMVHHPPYSAGYQGSNQAVRDAFGPLFEKHGVQLVLSGHDHDYQRSKTLNGVTYVVTGGSASTRRTGEQDFTAVSFSWHHFVELAIFPDHLVIRAVNQDLRVADEAVLLEGVESKD